MPSQTTDGKDQHKSDRHQVTQRPLPASLLNQRITSSPPDLEQRQQRDEHDQAGAEGGEPRIGTWQCAARSSGGSARAGPACRASPCARPLITLRASAAPSAMAAVARVLKISVAKASRNAERPHEAHERQIRQRQHVPDPGDRSPRQPAQQRVPPLARPGFRSPPAPDGGPRSTTSATMAATAKNSTCSISSWIAGGNPKPNGGRRAPRSRRSRRGSRGRSTGRRNGRPRPRSPAGAAQGYRARTRA